MTLPPATLAATALRVFKLRQSRPVPGHAEKLRPWAAVALRCGVDPAALGPDVARALEDLRRGTDLSDGYARAVVADDLCPLPRARADLARARDAALDALAEQVNGPQARKRERAPAGQAEPSGADAPRPAPEGQTQMASQDTQDLVVLAIHLGCPPYLPSSPRAPTRDSAHPEPVEGARSERELA